MLFIKRVNLFFLKRNIFISLKQDTEYLDFLFEKFLSSGLMRANSNQFRITAKFIIYATGQFLKEAPHKIIELLTGYRPLRFQNNRYNNKFNTTDFLYNFTTAKRSLIPILGRHKTVNYKITAVSGSPITPKTKQSLARRTKNFEISYTPIEKSTPTKARQRGVANHKRYEQDMVSRTFSLWREITPTKPGETPSPYRMEIRPATRARLLPGNVNRPVDAFAFKITAHDILQRQNTKRPISQKRVMNNQSALDTLVSLGAIIHEKQQGRQYHWAHRQGWSLNGDQNASNLDPTTAGSNYDTLFKVEAPIKELLLVRGVPEVQVKGRVEFNTETPIPEKIVYQLFWANNGFMQVHIDPTSHRIPTVSEHKMATLLYEVLDDDTDYSLPSSSAVV